MNKVTRTGSFRGYANDWGVSLTSNSECPQFTMEVLLTEYWDEDNECWVDYSDEEEYIPAYMVMISGAGKVLKNMEQIMKVFGWDGMDFDALAQGDYSEVAFQVRIGDNDPDYADKNPFVVEWLDVYDAAPGRGIKKLDSNELKALNKKFAGILKKNAGPAKPKSAPSNPKNKAAIVEETEDATPPASGKALTAKEKMERNKRQKELDDQKAEEKRANAEKLKKEKAELAAKQKAKKGDKGDDGDKPKTKRSMPSFQKPKPPVEKTEDDGDDDDVVLSLTQDEAWERIEAAQEQMGDDCTDEMVTEALMDAVKKVGDSDAPDTDSFTKEQWGQVSELTIRTLVGV